MLGRGVTGKAVVVFAIARSLSGDLIAQENQWRVGFQQGAQKSEAAAVTFSTPDGPVLAAVALKGADFPATKLLFAGKQISAKFSGYDAVTRLCFFKPDAAEIPIAPWLEKAPAHEGQQVSLAGGVGVLKGRVSHIGGKVLPLALLRVQCSGPLPVPGSPITSMDGRVIAVVFQNGDHDKEIYAIPAEAVHRVAKDVLANGKVIKGWLGISLMVENTEPRITKVWAESPAADAGLRPDDMIVRIGGTDVGDYADVANAFFYLIPGEAVELTVLRGGRSFRFLLTPTGERPN